jgi:hypothetical protein
MRVLPEALPVARIAKGLGIIAPEHTGITFKGAQE